MRERRLRVEGVGLSVCGQQRNGFSLSGAVCQRGGSCRSPFLQWPPPHQGLRLSWVPLREDRGRGPGAHGRRYSDGRFPARSGTRAVQFSRYSHHLQPALPGDAKIAGIGCLVLSLRPDHEPPATRFPGRSLGAGLCANGSVPVFAFRCFAGGGALHRAGVVVHAMRGTLAVWLPAGGRAFFSLRGRNGRARSGIDAPRGLRWRIGGWRPSDGGRTFRKRWRHGHKTHDPGLADRRSSLVSRHSSKFRDVWAAYLETGDPWLRDTAEMAADAYWAWFRSNWPRAAIGRDAFEVGAWALLARFGATGCAPERVRAFHHMIHTVLAERGTIGGQMGAGPHPGWHSSLYMTGVVMISLLETYEMALERGGDSRGALERSRTTAPAISSGRR